MKNIKAAGSPFEIGHALGREGAAAVRDASFATEQFQELCRWLGSDRLQGLEAAARRHFPALVREIEGIAEGAGQPFDKVFLWNCRGDLRDVAPSDEDACTSIMLPAMPGQPAILAHNEDGAPELAGRGFMARVEPAGGLAFDAYCYPGMLPGHAFGSNDAGLVQTINNIRPKDLVVGVPRHVVTRAVLDCADLDAALALLSRKDRASGFHHNLGDRSGRLLSVEAPASDIDVHEVAAPHAHANHLIRERFADLAQVVSASSAARQARAEELLAGGERDVLTILFDRTDPALPILCRADRDSADSYTLSTVVYRFAGGNVDWSVHHGPAREPVASGRHPA